MEAVKTEDIAVSKPVSKLVDTVAALVPVEVLAAHVGRVAALAHGAEEGGMFDAVTDWTNLKRIGIGTFLGLVAVIAAKSLAETAEEKTPQPAQAATLT